MINVPVEVVQHNHRAREVPPVTHQLTHGGEVAQDLNTGVAHAVIGVDGSLFTECAGRIRIGEHLVSLGTQRQRQERRAHLFYMHHVSMCVGHLLMHPSSIVGSGRRRRVVSYIRGDTGQLYQSI